MIGLRNVFSGPLFAWNLLFGPPERSSVGQMPSRRTGSMTRGREIAPLRLGRQRKGGALPTSPLSALKLARPCVPQPEPARLPSRIVVLCSFRVVSARVQPCHARCGSLTIPPPLVDLGDCRDFHAVLTPCALLCRREACAWEPRGLGGALRRLRCLRTKDFPLPHPIQVFTIATVPLTLPPRYSSMVLLLQPRTRQRRTCETAN